MGIQSARFHAVCSYVAAHTCAQPTASKDDPLVTELDRNLGALAYNTYRGYVDGFSVHGEQLPYWNGLTDTVKLAWMTAASAVKAEVTRWPTTVA